MTRKVNHSLLDNAKENKNDEFYTQLVDIERELVYYKDSFAGKTIYCNCDDPLTSNFFKFLFLNFSKFKLKKLICSCYNKNEIDLFACQQDKKGVFVEYSGEDTSDTPSEYAFKNKKELNEDGDFRSKECIELLKKADIVITNPPFSLFREYIAQLVKYDKKFLIIGNINAITYKEVFALIRDNKVWLGVNFGRGISGFIVPDSYELYGTETKIDECGNRIVSTNNCLWLTNIDNFKRHISLPLTKAYSGNESSYPFFDNYNGININRTQDIPFDFYGAMGVPITFLNKFNPEQFEIIKFRKGNDEKDLSIDGKCPYFRILIKRKAPLGSKNEYQKSVSV